MGFRARMSLILFGQKARVRCQQKLENDESLHWRVIPSVYRLSLLATARLELAVASCKGHVHPVDPAAPC